MVPVTQYSVIITDQHYTYCCFEMSSKQDQLRETSLDQYYDAMQLLVLAFK
jgi:hypothetical protein